MEMQKLSFENVDIAKINRDLELEPRLNLGDQHKSKINKQTTISDFL